MLAIPSVVIPESIITTGKIITHLQIRFLTVYSAFGSYLKFLSDQINKN